MSQTYSFRSLFAVHGYSQLYLARLVSCTAVWIDFTLIFSFLTFYWHASATEVGLASILYGLPGLLLGPLFGRLADQYSPFSLLYISYSIRAITSVALTLSDSIDIFLVIIFFKGIANLGVMPAEQVAMRAIISKEFFPASASLMTITDQTAKILSPLAAAAAVQQAMGANIFWISTSICLIGIALLTWLRINVGRIITNFAQNRKTFNMGNLISFMALKNSLMISFIASVISGFILGFYDPFLALFLKNLDFPPSVFGTIISCTAAGSVLGALFFKKIFSIERSLSIISLALICFGATVIAPPLIIASGTPLSFFILGALWVVNGGCFSLIAMTFSVSLQMECPAELIGTVSTTARSFQLGAMISAPLLSSVVSNATSISTTFVISGTLAIVTGLIILKLRP